MRLKFFKIFILFSLFYGTKPCWSQSSKIYTLRLAYPKYSEGMINCIYQDKAGFIWIGKESGLFRYDGNEVKSFFSMPLDTSTIGSNNISEIIEDPSGDLFIATKDGGLNRYNRKYQTFTRYTYKPNDESSISFDQISAICPDGKGNYWVGTDGGGLNFFNPNTGKFKTYKVGQKNSQGLKSNKIISIVPNGDGKFWLGTWAAGIFSFDPAKETFRQLGSGTSFAELNILSMCLVAPNVLWIGTFSDDLFSYDVKSGKFRSVLKSVNQNSFTNITMNSKGQIYMSSFAGLYYAPSINAACSRLRDASGEFNSLNYVYIDRAQSLWIANRYGDIGKMDFFKKKFKTLNSSVPFTKERAYAVAALGSYTYVRTSTDLVKYDVHSGRYLRIPVPIKSFSPMSSIKNTNSIILDSKDGLMEFNQQSRKLSAVLYDRKNFNAEVINKGVLNIHSSKSGIWIAGNQGAFLLSLGSKNGIRKVLKHFENGENGFINPHNSACVFEDQKGNLWVGSWGAGLNVLKAGKTSFDIFKHQSGSKGLSNNFVECINEDSKGNIWIGTRSGLNRYDHKTGDLKILTIANGLADDCIISIEIDAEDQVWITTRKGISSFSKDLRRIRNYDMFDGLPSKTFIPRASTQDQQGVIYVGSNKGLVWFHPDSIQDNPHLASPAIVDFKINNKNISIGAKSPLNESVENIKSIKLKADQNTFSFRMTALGYFNVKRQKLAYKLEGQDNNWRQTGNNSEVNYSDIPAGTYTFLLKASNEDGVWNPQIKRLELVIGRPMWLSNWAVLFYFLVTCAATYLFFNFKRIIPNAIGPNNALIPKQKINPDLIQPAPIDLPPASTAYLQKAISIVEENMSASNFGVQEFSDKMCQSQRQVSRRMNEVVGLTIAEFIKELRLKRAAQMLSDKGANVSEVAYSVGFSNPKYFSKCFKEQFGVPPGQYK